MNKTLTAEENQHLIEQKLATFDAMQAEFEACFRFLQAMHGQRRFESFVVGDAVYYLHARWICERKGRLLSVAKTAKEYEGHLCLELLQRWQDGDTSSVVRFFNRKLDLLPVSDITQQLHEANQQHLENGVVERIEHGRRALLNRGMHLTLLLDALFALSDDDLIKAVQEACVQYGHTPEQIAQQLQEMDSPLFAYVPHQLLAQRNMLVMNIVGTQALVKPVDLPEHRSWRVVKPTAERDNPPFAEHVVEGYQELVSPSHNNIKNEQFVDRVEPDDSGEVV